MIHRNLSDSIYHSWQGASASRLNMLSEMCPAKVLYKMENPDPPTPDMQLGTALHKLAIEGQIAYEEAYYIEPVVNRRTNDGKAELKAAAAANPGKRAISLEDDETIHAMNHSAQCHPIAGKLIRKAVEREVSIEWTDKEFNVPCKARLDMISDAGGLVVVDFKKCRDVAAADKSTANYRYHAQLAWYVDAARNEGLDVDELPSLIMIEDAAPYIVRVLQPENSEMELGRIENRRNLAKFAECWHSGIWPGYRELDTLRLPDWYPGIRDIRKTF